MVRGDADLAMVVEWRGAPLALPAGMSRAPVMEDVGDIALPEGVRVVPVQPAPVRQVYAFWRTDASRRPAIRATVRALREAAGTRDEHASGAVTP